MLRALTQAATAATNPLARAVFLDAARRLRVGSLTIEMPDGRAEDVRGVDSGPHAVLQVKDPAFYRQFLLHGEIGFGEAYQHRLCDSPDLVALLELALLNRQAVDFNKGILSLVSRLGNRRLHERRGNTLERSSDNIHAHYDLGNAFFQLFLDETLTYSCAVFERPDQPLADAQRNKYDRICRMAGIGEGDRVLEIGTGWGGFAIHAAKTYGCNVTSITISREQLDLATQRVEEAGVASLVDIQFADYRDVAGRYDKVVSIEMFEAVGVEYFETFFAKCAGVLEPGGKLVMQVITVAESSYEAQQSGVNWIQKYIFPGGVLPSVEQMERSNAGTGLVVASVEDIGAHYVTTLQQWRQSFWDRIDAVRALGYDDWFIRTWDYYLAACEAEFRTRTARNVQIVFDKAGQALHP